MSSTNQKHNELKKHKDMLMGDDSQWVHHYEYYYFKLKIVISSIIIKICIFNK